MKRSILRDGLDLDWICDLGCQSPRPRRRIYRFIDYIDLWKCSLLRHYLYVFRLLSSILRIRACDQQPCHFVFALVLGSSRPLARPAQKPNQTTPARFLSTTTPFLPTPTSDPRPLRSWPGTNLAKDQTHTLYSRYAVFIVAFVDRYRADHERRRDATQTRGGISSLDSGLDSHRH